LGQLKNSLISIQFSKYGPFFKGSVYYSGEGIFVNGSDRMEIVAPLGEKAITIVILSVSDSCLPAGIADLIFSAILTSFCHAER
jgi:hypothetical protein